MAKSIDRNAIKEYLETNTSLSGKDLKRGIDIVLVFVKLGMVKKDDVEFERDKIRTIRKICVKNNNVELIARRTPDTRPSIMRMEIPAEKLKRLLDQQ